ncbi:MAG TPA: hypothetical protein ENK06_11940, partial [Gammaproteobacteria bacterium]|nr:hypothetical protein [Gammaproteobacteria bacterium]
MSFSDNIQINTYYTRSINLERDADSLDVVKAYIPTTRALQTLEKIKHSLTEDKSPRAWSLVGPYGSGKSSFANFISHLLANSDHAASAAAEKLLASKDATLARQFKKIKKDKHGHCCILLTGSPEPLSKSLMQAIAASAEQYFSHMGKKKLKIISDLYAIAQQQTVSTKQIVDAVKKLQKDVAKHGGNGVLILIDELGKFLEYEARHYGANEIYLLQALAEHAYADNAAKLSVMVLLHQSFEQYAKGLGESVKSEWAKVQGRYENIAFLESQEQVLRVVGSAFEHSFTVKERTEVSKYITTIVNRLEKEKAFPGTMNRESALQIFPQCYPLHPLSALILPILCQKIAQNERTLFSYLGSQESHGFKDSLTRIEKPGDMVYPWEIYEYFILNQPASINDHITSKRWAEVAIAIERLGDASENEVNVLKTIGLFNIIGAHGGLKASKRLIELCLPRKKQVKDALDALIEKSIIQFRKFSSEYRVWQGSDFDIEQAVEEEKQKLGQFSLAEILNANNSLLPIVARKYTIKHGSLRYFQPYFVDAQTLQQIPRNHAQTRLLIFLKDSDLAEGLFETGQSVAYSALDIVVECLNTPLIREVVGEVIALEQVQKSAQELHSDPVAKREFSDRYNAAIKRREEQLANIINFPENQQWYWQQKLVPMPNKRALQSVMSDVLENIYHACPDVKNELVNRDSPSAQANAARNKLLQLMLNHEAEADLGIDKFPAEKAIYRAVLRETGLHKKQDDGNWRFVAPSKRSTFYKAWKKINTFLDATEKQARSLAELNKELMAAPYGIKAGVLPILYVSVYLTYKHELALYENRRYKPYMTDEMLERFVKRPDEFTFQRFNIKESEKALLKHYSQVLFDDTNHRSMLQIAQKLVSEIHDLPVYTLNTVFELNQKTLLFRDGFDLEISIRELLFEHIPKSLGDAQGHVKSDFSANNANFEAPLVSALEELRLAYNKLILRQIAYISQILGSSNRDDLPIL